jgi:peptidoglycan/LPS O-acetylase OafA/YrhL
VRLTTRRNHNESSSRWTSRQPDASAVTGSGYNPSLDGLRAIAVLLVVITHTLGGPPGWTLGVDVFFVLSGFLITNILVDELARRGSVSLRRFYIRRVFRLFPALFVFLVVVLIWTQAFAPPDGVAMVHGTVIGGLSYVENWHIIAVGQVGSVVFPRDPAAQIWSLSVEEQFYLVWPLILITAWAWKGKRAALIVALCGLFVAMGDTFGLAWFGTTFGRVYYGTDTRAVQLLAGCSVALLAQCGLVPRLPRLVSVVALVAILLIGVFPLPLIYQQSAIALLSGLLIAGLSQHQFWLLATRPARWLGQRSYSVYLWHPFIGVILFYQFHVGDGLGMLVMVLLLSLVIADVSFRWIESPLRNFGRRLSNRVGAADLPGKPVQPIPHALVP